MKKTVFIFLLLSTFSQIAYPAGKCTPPGERAYYERWMVTESQSLLHKCALGGLVDFGVLNIFDPTKMILDIISGKACAFARQKTQPFRDDLTEQIDAVNSQVKGANTAQGKGAWSERIDSAFAKDSKTKSSPTTKAAPAQKRFVPPEDSPQKTTKKPATIAPDTPSTEIDWSSIYKDTVN